MKSKSVKFIGQIIGLRTHQGRELGNLRYAVIYVMI